MSDPSAKITARRVDTEVVSDYPIADLSTDALLTTTRSVRKRLDLTKPVPRKQPTLTSAALSLHASVHGGALLTRVNRWLG